MRCSHCSVDIHPHWQTARFAGPVTARNGAKGWFWYTRSSTCSACGRHIVQLGDSAGSDSEATWWQVFPLTGHAAVPPDVPEPYANDFREASVVLAFSPKASAAISRRLLQMLLVDQGQAKKRDLVEQIDEVKSTLPKYIVTTLDAVRAVGNFAAHAMKDKNTGAVLDVEPNEAELTLEAIEELLRFYFTDPQASAKKLAALQLKLDAAGKPKLKTS